MAGTYKKAYALCPFFKQDDDDKRRIVCEGLVDDSSLTLSYIYSKDYRSQMDIFCCGAFESCEVFRMLIRDKYEEE